MNRINREKIVEKLKDDTMDSHNFKHKIQELKSRYNMRDIDVELLFDVFNIALSKAQEIEVVSKVKKHKITEDDFTFDTLNNLPCKDVNWRNVFMIFASDTKFTYRSVMVFILFHSGFSTEIIGSIFGVSRQRIHDILQRTYNRLNKHEDLLNAVDVKEKIQERGYKVGYEMGLAHSNLKLSGQAQKINEDFVPNESKEIEALDLSLRAYNCIRRANIRLIEQVEKMGAYDLYKIRNMGWKCVREIREKLKERNPQYEMKDWEKFKIELHIKED